MRYSSPGTGHTSGSFHSRKVRKESMPMLNALHGELKYGAGFAPTTAGTATRPETPAQQTSMKKVALLVGIAIVVFMAFTGYSVRKEIQGSAQLSAIKELYFPVLQRL